jgi:RNA polymerase sigma-70 factor (ECF subfamily)
MAIGTRGERLLTEDTRKQIEDLFRRHGAGVGRYLLLRVGNSELAEEITARVFLSVVRNFHQVRGPVAGWLWSVVRTELARHYRQPPLQAFPAELADGDPPPFEQLERAEAAEWLRVCVAKLPEDEQQLLELKFFLGLGNQEIAAITGLTTSNVGVKVHRALKTMRGLLARPLALDQT